MKRKAALFVAAIALLLSSCLPVEPPVIDPPAPPTLTMKQQQFKWQADRKNHGMHVDPNTPPSGFVYLGAE